MRRRQFLSGQPGLNGSLRYDNDNNGRSDHDGNINGRITDKADLLRKMTGVPDFPDDNGHRSGSGPDRDSVRLVAHVPFPTRSGQFMLYGFYDGYDNLEHTAVVKGDLRGAEDCPVRVHSECHTGDVWGSLRCDCRDQLEASLAYINKASRGAVVYMRQEGRGIGLLNKIKAYHLQDLGLDTVEANEFLGFPAEARSYVVTARIIELLGIRSIALLSNNPDKIEQLTREGITVVRRIPLVVDANPYNEQYLETKKGKMGHLF